MSLRDMSIMPAAAAASENSGRVVFDAKSLKIELTNLATCMRLRHAGGAAAELTDGALRRPSRLLLRNDISRRSENGQAIREGDGPGCGSGERCRLCWRCIRGRCRRE